MSYVAIDYFLIYHAKKDGKHSLKETVNLPVFAGVLHVYFFVY